MAAIPEVRLKVGGKLYGGWKSISITRSIEAIAGSYELSVSERWPRQVDPWPIADGEECSVSIGDTTVITGYVDQRRTSFQKDAHVLTVSGRDRTGDLVDCSIDTKKWELTGQTVDRIVRDLAAPFGIPVTVAPGVAIPKAAPKFSLEPGESAFDAASRAATKAGLLLVSDGVGGIVLTRAGHVRATSALVQGENLLTGDASFSQEQRFGRYIVAGAQQGSDETSGKLASSVLATATDRNVRPSRVLMIRPDGSVTAAQAKQLADWNAAVRAGRSSSVEVSVQGWLQSDGSLWPLNGLVPLRAEWLGYDADMLISEQTFALDSQWGTHTRMRLMRPDAYLPEPVLPDKKAKGESDSGPYQFDGTKPNLGVR